MIDRLVGHYRVISKLGEGGMGQVYAARDEKLHRTVALKWVSPSILPNEHVRRAFLREARAAAALNHPFICSVHEVLDDEGQAVIVMERVEGETLDARIRRGPLPVEEIRSKSIEIAEALASAHDRGIVHRDIKSANIMVTSSGHVKVMDFGLAVITTAQPQDETAHQSETNATGIVGTLPYLSPEVLSGQKASVSSDLYALGVVLYEMATGRRPFDTLTQAVLISDILNVTPARPREINNAVPRWLDELIADLLNKDPARRPRSASELIDRLRSGTSSGPRGDRRSIAVLPFQALTHDPDSAHLGIGLADTTIAELAMVRSLLVRPTAAILRYDDRKVDPIEAGRQLEVDAIVAGTFQRSGQRVRVTVQLIDVAEARPLWSVKIDDTLDDVFAMQDEVSRKIAEALQVQLTPADERRFADRVQPAGAALDAWMRGRIALLHDHLEDVHEAIRLFDLVRDLEPHNPLGWLGLADAYLRMAFTWDPGKDWYARAKSMCDHAIELAPALPEIRYVRARLAWCPDGGWDHDFALSELAATIAERPNMNEAFDWLAVILVHVGVVDEGRETYRRALAIDPTDELALSHLSFVEEVAGNYRASIELSTKRLEIAPRAWPFYSLARAKIHLEDLAGAEATLDKAEREFPESALYTPLRGVIAARRGDDAGALRAIEQTEQRHRSFGHFHHAEVDIAGAFAVMKRPDDALRFLNRAVDNGYPCLAAVESDTLLDPIRSHPGYEDLEKRLRASRDHFARKYASLVTSNH